jgi:hypothetical protein
MPSAAAALIALIALVGSSAARAEEMGADVGVATGVEGGDAGDGHTVFRRARTRVRASVDLRNEEDRRHALWVVGFVELEPHTAAGAEVRYGHWLSPRFAVFGGATGIFAPHVALGGTAGAHLSLPLKKLDIAIFAEPALSALPFGTDLPDGSVLTWAHLTVGVRTDLSTLLAPPPPPKDARVAHHGAGSP